MPAGRTVHATMRRTDSPIDADRYTLAAMIDFTPSPIAFHLGPIAVYWYGIGYALGIAAAAWMVTREARRRGLNTDLIPNGLIVIAIAALIGGRLYHVIDQWHLYKDDLLKIVEPPYTGLGIYGGVALGGIAFFAYTRYYRQSFWAWGDVAAPAILLTQAIARWGNFFNQELYGPPTNLPWGIAIQCQYRVAEFACPAGSSPTATLGQHFIPLFLYESILSFIGVGVFLWLLRRKSPRLRIGDVALAYFMWYGVERFLLEFFRSGYNWTFFTIPTAQVVSAIVVLGALVVLIIRHRMPPETAAPVTSPTSGPDGPERELVASAAADPGRPTTHASSDPGI